MKNVAAIILAATFTYFVSSEGSASKDVDFCKYSYSFQLTNYDVPVCSMFKLSDRDIAKVDWHSERAVKLYASWFKKRFPIPEDKKKINLSIFFVTEDVLNDKNIFPRNENSQIVGRYTYNKGWVFLTPHFFKEEGRGDLAHEIAHWANDVLLHPREIDERTADQFERYYLLRIRKYKNVY